MTKLTPSAFLRGLAIGFAIAAPVGPIGVICIRRSLAEGRLAGFVSGLGAATADGAYGLVAAMGLSSVAAFLIGHQGWLRLVGGVFLCVLGYRTMVTQPSERAVGSIEISLLGAYTSTFALTLTNPLTILSFAAVFAGLGLGSTIEGYRAGAMLVLGVFLGSACWWALLSSITGTLHSKVELSKLRWVNRVSGIIIAAFGLAALVAAVR